MTHYVVPMPDTRNVILTGFMGTGKTTVGLILARRLGRQFVDTDKMIEERHGPIESIFVNSGEARFRDLERRLADELASQQGLVIATGGGMLVDSSVVRAFEQNGEVICLVASPSVLLNRLEAENATRPLLSADDPGAAIENILRQRHTAYERFRQIETDDLTPDEVADRIVELVSD